MLEYFFNYSVKLKFNYIINNFVEALNNYLAGLNKLNN